MTCRLDECDGEAEASVSLLQQQLLSKETQLTEVRQKPGITGFGFHYKEERIGVIIEDMTRCGWRP